MTATADQIQIDEAAVRGQVVRPADPDYDVHRKIWNGSFDKHPALIVRCTGVADVIAAVKFGRASGLPVAVRSGGHSFPGLSVADDALMIDLSPNGEGAVLDDLCVGQAGPLAVLPARSEGDQVHAGASAEVRGGKLRPQPRSRSASAATATRI